MNVGPAKRGLGNAQPERTCRSQQSERKRWRALNAIAKISARNRRLSAGPDGRRDARGVQTRPTVAFVLSRVATCECNLTLGFIIIY